MNRKRFIFLTAVMCFMVAFVSLVSGEKAYARTQPPMPMRNLGTLYLYNKKPVTITMKGAKSKIKWYSSNKKVARVVKKSGKYGQTIKIKPGKSGSCDIYTVINNKYYVYHINVYKANYKKGRTKVAVSKVDYSKSQNKLTVDVKICNGSGKKLLGYFEEYRVDRYTDGKWQVVPFKDGIGFIEPYYTMYPKSYVTKSYDLASSIGIEKFTPGKYRIRVGVDMAKEKRYAAFTIK